MRRHMFVAACLAVFAVISTAVPRGAQVSAADAARRETLDQILDTYVRDGYVYYRALKIERGKLDGYVTQLATVDANKLSRDAQLAFWLNAYNALVLQTVIDHYPIQQRSADYPQHSIRQIPGAFERLPHQVAGRMVTLDQIEQTVLAKFNDPRAYFAIGRGAVGGGRLRSEAFAPATIEKQLAEVAGECASRLQCVHVDIGANKLTASAIFSWREKDFVATYAGKAASAYANRSPIERAILAFVEPKLLIQEREFLTKNAFQLAYEPFDWSLDDLTGRGGL